MSPINPIGSFLKVKMIAGPIIGVGFIYNPKLEIKVHV